MVGSQAVAAVLRDPEHPEQRSGTVLKNRHASNRQSAQRGVLLRLPPQLRVLALPVRASVRHSWLAVRPTEPKLRFSDTERHPVEGDVVVVLVLVLSLLPPAIEAIVGIYLS